MVTDATKKLREPVAYILLAFAGLFVLASLIPLFIGESRLHGRRRRRARYAHPALRSARSCCWSPWRDGLAGERGR